VLLLFPLPLFGLLALLYYVFYPLAFEEPGTIAGPLALNRFLLVVILLPEADFGLFKACIIATCAN